MRIILFFDLWLLFVIVNARKRTKQRNIDLTDKSIDLRGNIRKSFALVYGINNFKNNTICSPVSALLAVGKLALGAENRSLDELIDGIGVRDIEEIRLHFGPIIASLKYLPGVNLDIASRFYIDETTHLLSQFEDQAKEIFEAGVVKVNFEAPVTTAENINDWVSSQTNGKITDIVRSDDISPESSLILINAVYFYGKWKDPFETVQISTFHTPTDVRRVNMMTITTAFNYSDCTFLNSKLLNLPYVGGKASFLMILPNIKSGLKILLTQLKLAPELLSAAIDEMQETRVRLSMPKFKIESDMNLRDVLEKTGIKRIFNKYESGLNGIKTEGPIFLSKARQKAIIEVDEFGTEAAAVSAGIAQLSMQKTIQFRADHPFLFFILADKQQLFAGTVVYPN